MRQIDVETLSAEELELVLLAGKIKGYAELAEYNFLTEYYITTGEITLDVERAAKNLDDTDKPHHKELLSD